MSSSGEEDQQSVSSGEEPGQLASQLDALDAKLDRILQVYSAIEGKLNSANRRLGAMEKRLEAVEARGGRRQTRDRRQLPHRNPTPDSRARTTHSARRTKAYKPEVRTMAILRERVEGAWDASYMGMARERFRSIVGSSYGNFLRALLLEMFGTRELATMTLGRRSGNAVPMVDHRRDEVNRLVAAYCNAHPTADHPSLEQLSKDVSHVLSNMRAHPGTGSGGVQDPGEGSSRHQSGPAPRTANTTDTDSD